METEVINQAVDLAPAMGYLIEILSGLALAAGIWVAKLLADKLGLEKDDKVRAYLMQAVENGVALGKKKASMEVNNATWTKVEIDNATVAEGTKYVLARVPDAVKRFNLNEEAVKDMVLSKLDVAVDSNKEALMEKANKAIENANGAK